MTDKELIKQEIEYRLSSGKYSINSKQALEDIIVFIDSLPEEPVSEDLEEEINHISKNEYFDFSDWKSIARHFTEWQKQKDFEELLKSDMSQFKECYEKGRFDMREEMMKDAVDAFVNTYENIDDSNYVEFVTEQSPYKFKETEKCKLIIIKEE